MKSKNFNARVRAITPNGSHVITIPRQHIKDGTFQHGTNVNVTIQPIKRGEPNGTNNLER